MCKRRASASRMAVGRIKPQCPSSGAHHTPPQGHTSEVVGPRALSARRPSVGIDPASRWQPARLCCLLAALGLGCQQGSEGYRSPEPPRRPTSATRPADAAVQRPRLRDGRLSASRSAHGERDLTNATDTGASSDARAGYLPGGDSPDLARISKTFGVRVHVAYNRENYFPAEWRSPPASAKGSQIKPAEAQRITRLIPGFLSMYPPALITENLRHVFLLESMSFYGLEYGGTNSRDAIYIASLGRTRPHHDVSVAALMHSELSSILYRNYDFPSGEWRQANEDTWVYIGEGKDLLGRSDLFEQSDDLFRKGFIFVYGQASLEEDVNTYVLAVIHQWSRLRSAAASYARVRRKLAVLIRFYEGIKARTHADGDFGFLNRLKSVVGLDVAVPPG
jgi:hypothetical protein